MSYWNPSMCTIHILLAKIFKNYPWPALRPTYIQIRCSDKVLPQIYAIFIKIQLGEAGTRTKVHLSQWRQTRKKIRPQPLGMLLLTPWLWEPAATCNPNLQLQVSNEEHLISWHDSHRLQNSAHFCLFRKNGSFHLCVKGVVYVLMCMHACDVDVDL